MPKNPTRRPHFFKVLMHDFSNRLRIPPAFIKHIARKQEPRKAKILSPLGRTFEVEIEGDMEELYFGAGWQQLVLAHDLDLGYFLVFRYEGSLAFHLRVLDITGCEKEYRGIVGDDENHAKTAKRRRNASYIANENTKGSATRSFKGKAAKGTTIPPPEVKKSSYGDEARVRSPPESKKRKITRMSRVTAKTAEPGDIVAARGGAPGFEIVVSPSSGTRFLNIPVVFALQNKAFRGQEAAVLIDPEGRLWTVGVLHYHMFNRSQFSRGWKAFAESNNLKPGDACTFELLPGSEGKQCMFQVHINKTLSSPACGAFPWPSTGSNRSKY